MKELTYAFCEVAIYFSPDRLNANVQALSHIFDGDSLLMVCGNFALLE
ncbi:hypothetical protein [Tolypothrix sp. NIES-4075]|nr:hypothetical protein [Tolypothrix sp. NIES-4075]